MKFTSYVAIILNFFCLQILVNEARGKGGPQPGGRDESRQKDGIWNQERLIKSCQKLTKWLFTL